MKKRVKFDTNYNEYKCVKGFCIIFLFKKSIDHCQIGMPICQNWDFVRLLFYFDTGGTKEAFPQCIIAFLRISTFWQAENPMAKNGEPDYDQLGDEGECKVKIICLGDSAVGKSK